MILMECYLLSEPKIRGYAEFMAAGCKRVCFEYQNKD